MNKLLLLVNELQTCDYSTRVGVAQAILSRSAASTQSHHMQMTDSDFTVNDWRRRLGGGAGHYTAIDSSGLNLRLSRP